MPTLPITLDKMYGELCADWHSLHDGHDEIDQESHLSSLEGEILRGTHFYYVGYEGKNNRLMVVDIDLDKMFPEAKDWIKKKMN